ncbi:MAG: M20/M25/M40 family metallo-hydrolase [Candidatus Acidiferrales bacterium]
MNVFELTRAVVDIESVTNHEEAVGAYLFQILSDLAARTGGTVERCPVEAGRCNVFACWGQPLATLSTHMDTVPPFFPSREDEEFIWGRGAADAKGIIASMIGAAGKLLAEGARNFGLLFVVGEERNSAGALAAARDPRGSLFLVNGEPTDNKLVLAAKGILRYEISASGRLAHSAYPELGESAIDKLLDALQALREIPLPEDDLLGRSTLNIGVIYGGRAPNVVPDAALAEISIRLVGSPDAVRAAVARAVAGRAEAREVVFIPAMRFASYDGVDSTVVSYTTDVPAFAGAWGEPFLIGPGSIQVAHTLEERVPKKELLEAVDIYKKLVLQLLARASEVARP